MADKKVTKAAPQVDKPKGLVADAGGPAHDSKSAVHPDSVANSMKVPPQFQQAFIGGCKAVMHFVTDPKTHRLFLNGLAGPGPVEQKLSEGVINVLKFVVHFSKGQFPPQMYMPVGMWAISWIADYVRRSHLAPIEDADIGKAMQMFLHSTLEGLKNGASGGLAIHQANQARLNPQQLKHGPGGPGGAPAPGGPPGQPGAPPAPPGPQPGPAMPKMTAPPQQAPGANPSLGPGAAPGPQGLIQAQQG